MMAEALMPIHDWKSAPPGLFHHFHQQWTVELCTLLNAGILPDAFPARAPEEGMVV